MSDVPRILVIEDDVLLQEVEALLLDRAGLAAHFASTIAEAVAYMESHHAAVDLVVLDMMLPDGNGAEALSQLRAIDPHVMVVLCTAYDVCDLEAEVLQAVVGVVEKIHLVGQFLPRVEEALRRRGCLDQDRPLLSSTPDSTD